MAEIQLSQKCQCSVRSVLKKGFQMLLPAAFSSPTEELLEDQTIQKHLWRKLWPATAAFLRKGNCSLNSSLFCEITFFFKWKTNKTTDFQSSKNVRAKWTLTKTMVSRLLKTWKVHLFIKAINFSSRAWRALKLRYKFLVQRGMWWQQKKRICIVLFPLHPPTHHLQSRIVLPSSCLDPSRQDREEGQGNRQAPATASTAAVCRIKQDTQSQERLSWGGSLLWILHTHTDVYNPHLLQLHSSLAF